MAYDLKRAAQDESRKAIEELRDAEMKVARLEKDIKGRDQEEKELKEKVKSQGGTTTLKQPGADASNKEIDRLKREKKEIEEKLDAKIEELGKFKRDTEAETTAQEILREKFAEEMSELRQKSKREAKANEEAKAALEDELKRSRDQIETLNRKLDAMEKRVKSGPSGNEEKDKGPAASEVEREPEEGKKKNADADGVGGDSGNQQPRGNDDPMDVDGGNAPAEKDKETPKSEPMKTESGNAPDKSGPQVGRDGDKDKEILTR